MHLPYIYADITTQLLNKNLLCCFAEHRRWRWLLVGIRFRYRATQIVTCTIRSWCGFSKWCSRTSLSRMYNFYCTCTSCEQTQGNIFAWNCNFLFKKIRYKLSRISMRSDVVISIWLLLWSCGIFSSCPMKSSAGASVSARQTHTHSHTHYSCCSWHTASVCPHR